jgi:rSAM/selenodomain-associated transferase 2
MLSIIIPTLNAADHIANCLAALAPADELIVADGGSSDATAAVAHAAAARVIVSERGRGHQLRAGAGAATGDWLLFLHADTRLSAGWREEVEKHIRGRPAFAACFRFRLDDPAWQARLIERGVALRNSLLGLPYGDQGLLLSRSLYEQVGGYAPLPLMEDVDLVRRLPQRVALLPVNALTSADRWRRDGWLRRSARNLACLTLYRLGVPAERVARLYA